CRVGDAWPPSCVNLHALCQDQHRPDTLPASAGRCLLAYATRAGVAALRRLWAGLAPLTRAIWGGWRHVQAALCTAALGGGPRTPCWVPTKNGSRHAVPPSTVP